MAKEFLVLPGRPPKGPYQIDKINPTKRTVANVAMTNADQEYNYTFPVNTVKFLLKLRAQNAKFKYSWTVGESGTTYQTIPQNSPYKEDDLSVGGKLIYFQSDIASQVMEIVSYQI